LARPQLILLNSFPEIYATGGDLLLYNYHEEQNLMLCLPEGILFKSTVVTFEDCKNDFIFFVFPINTLASQDCKEGGYNIG